MSLKRDILKDFEIKLEVSSHISSKQNNKTLSVLRIIMFDMNENFEQLSSIKELFQSEKTVPPLSTRNELMTIQELQKLCQEKLNDFPHTLS